MTDRAAWRPPRWLDVLTGWSWRLLVVGALVLAAVVGLSKVRPVVLPLLLGLVVTSVLWPLVGMMRARGVPRAVAAGIGLLLVVAAVALLVGLLVEALIGPWEAIVDQVEVELADLPAHDPTRSTSACNPPSGIASQSGRWARS